MSTVLQDLRYAIRMLAKAPGFALVAIATLTLGIGLNTAMFSVVHTVLLKRLPFGEPDRLVAVFESHPEKGYPQFTVSPPNYLDWSEQNRSFSAMAAYTTGKTTLTGTGQSKQVHVLLGSPSLLGLLQASPILGRGFLPEEGTYGHDKEVILSHAFWQQEFGGDRNIIGKPIHFDEEAYTIVGVLPPGFRFPATGSDVWMPLAFMPNIATQRGAHWLDVIGRLKDGVTLEQARDDIAQISGRLATQYPRTNHGTSAVAYRLQDSLVGEVRPALLVLLGAVGFVILIACVNVANLLLARSSARERELAIRAALGASRQRIIRQLLTESVLLSLVGAVSGLTLAYWLQTAIVGYGPKDVPLLDSITMSAPVLAFTVALSVLTAILFGLLPAFRAAGTDLHVAMRSGTMGSIGLRHHRSMRNSLVVAELALSVMLLVGAGLLIRSFARLSGVDPGFDSRNVLTFNLSVPDNRYTDPNQINRYFDDVLARFRSLPGVESVGTVNGLPLAGFRFSSSMEIDHKEDPLDRSAQLRVASDGYFSTMKIALVQGRLFTAADRMETQKVILISTQAAKTLFPSGDAIGHHVKFGARPGFIKLEGDIVGIVGDVHDSGLEANPPPMFYAPLAQSGSGYTSVVIRTQGNPEDLIPSIREQMRQVDADIPLADAMPLTEVVATSMSERRFYMFLLGLFAMVALTLAVVGIYGVISYTVSQRTQEIGIRVALGAREADIVRMVLGEALAMVGLGVGVGILTAMMVTRFLSSLLFGVSRHDPLTLAVVSLTLVTFALVASYWPARRATQVDPLVALRSE
jgi:putative ABC transport system permease protein